MIQNIILDSLLKIDGAEGEWLCNTVIPEVFIFIAVDANGNIISQTIQSMQMLERNNESVIFKKDALSSILWNEYFMVIHKLKERKYDHRILVDLGK